MVRYAITDRMRFATAGDDVDKGIVLHARKCAAAGVDFVQLREKDLAPRDLVRFAREMLKIFRAEGQTQLLINSRADVAVAAGADGVHLTSAEGELTPAHVRSLYASADLPEPIVSISCHTLEDAGRARGLEPGLILFGPVFEKVVAAGVAGGDRVVADGTGLELLRSACAVAKPIRVLALGGVTEANAQECVDAGAAGVAGIRLFSAV